MTDWERKMTPAYPALLKGQAVWITSGGYGIKIGTGAVLVEDVPESDMQYSGVGPSLRFANGKVRTVNRAAFVPLLPDEEREPWMLE